MKHISVSLKIIKHAKYYIWKPTICICENRKYLKSHVDDLKIMCEKTICYLLLYVYMLLHYINKCYKYCSKKTSNYCVNKS